MAKLPLFIFGALFFIFGLMSLKAKKTVMPYGLSGAEQSKDPFTFWVITALALAAGPALIFLASFH
jgi:hypothetical protein